MSRYIRISPPAAGPEEPRRLNAYPGRYLSEREFELLQAYVDDRIAPLLATLPPGIVQGMALRPEGAGTQTVLHIQPGIAVSSAGSLVRLFYPLHQAWTELVTLVEREHDRPLRDGYYFLTLRATVEAVDDTAPQDAGTRLEADPTRERRLETVILPGLQFISANPRLLAMPQDQAGNRLCVRFLQTSAHALCAGATPIAVIKVRDRLPQWVDSVAGRYLATDDAPYRTLLAHSSGVMERWLSGHEQGNPHETLASLFGIDYLPAAGALPPNLLRDAAGKEPQLDFAPADLQVEMAPVPASTVAAVVERELSRGSVDLVHGLGERIRLLLAIPDLDYRPDLLDLPQRDTQLEDQLFQREMAAVDAWSAWYQQWQRLYRGLDAPQSTLYQVPPLRERPGRTEDWRTALCQRRRAAMDDATAPLPEPYASHLREPHVYPPYAAWLQVPGGGRGDPPLPAEQLFVQRDALVDDMDALERDLDEGYRLLNEMNDYLNLQRQQLDNLTLSFSALAGGVVGDGSGSSMMRWNGAALFEQAAAKTGGSNSGNGS